MEIVAGALWIIAGLFILFKRGIGDSIGSAVIGTVCAVFFLAAIYLAYLVVRWTGSFILAMLLIFGSICLFISTDNKERANTGFSILGIVLAINYALWSVVNSKKVNSISVVVLALWAFYAIVYFANQSIRRKEKRILGEPEPGDSVFAEPTKESDRVWLNGRFVDADKAGLPEFPAHSARHRRSDKYKKES